jgi:hypothetical protein
VAAPDELTAWLHKRGLAKYEAALRVDGVVSVSGLSFLNLDEWKELGLSNKYQIRRVMDDLKP